MQMRHRSPCPKPNRCSRQPEVAASLCCGYTFAHPTCMGTLRFVSLVNTSWIGRKISVPPISDFILSTCSAAVFRDASL